jgi:hypothetical protein
MEWLSMFFTSFVVRFHNIKEFVVNFFRYYLWNPKFFLLDMLNLSFYFFKSPYRMLRRFDEENPGLALGPYGETDFRMFEKILDAFSIPQDVAIADLGAGRGRLCFWLALVRHQKKVVGVEPFLPFVERARRLITWFSVAEFCMIPGSIETVSLDGIDVVYAYTLDPGRQHILADTLSALPKGSKVITVGSSLQELKPAAFFVESVLPVHFVWGDTTVFLQTVQ